MDYCEHSFINVSDYLMCAKCCFIQYIQKQNNVDECCNKKHIVEDGSDLICRNCGVVDCSILFNTNEINIALFHKSTLFYKRKKYIKRKLDLMTEKPPIENVEEFNKLIDICKKDIAENEPLKIISILQKQKLTKYKKYYYYIYYVLFNKKLINLTPHHKNEIIKIFLKFENELKKYNIKYLNNYNEILRIIMKHLNIEDYKNILFPKTCSKNMDVYELILKNI